MNKDGWLSASEIGNWAYCHRAWWLRYVRGETPANEEAFRRGLVGHVRHATLVRRGERYQQAARVVLFIALLLLLILVWSMARGGVL